MTRGERNNNPMNVRQTHIKWLGESEKDLDPGFEEFESPVMGIRAGCKVLLTYFDKHKLRTIESIITRWAPTNENDTESYIKDVERRMAIWRDVPLNIRDRNQLCSLAIAIIAHENGRIMYPFETIMEGVDRALGIR